MAVPHVIIRAKRRYGVELDHFDLDCMQALIVCGSSQYVRPGAGPTREIHFVWCERAGMNLPVVWDNSTGQLCTVLPHNASVLQLGKPRKPKMKVQVFKQFEPDDPPTDEGGTEGPVPHEQAPNDAMAEALRRAFEKAGMAAPFVQNSHLGK